jgi:hypothetical protein
MVPIRMDRHKREMVWRERRVRSGRHLIEVGAKSLTKPLPG